MDGAWFEAESEKKKASREARGKPAAGLPGRLAETLAAARDSKSLADVAKTRALAVSTIVKHLEELSEIGKLARTDFVHLLPDVGAIDEIHEALTTTGREPLSPVFHALGGRYSFETIRLVRLARD